MVRTRKNGLTVLLVAVLFACLAALSFFVPTKGVSAADGTEGSPSDAVMTAEDLQSDISAAGIGDTVTLTGNVNGNITVGADADVIIDLKGFEMTSSTQGMPTVKNEGKLKIVDSSADKTGVITRENTATYYVVVNEGDLTLDGVTVRNDNAADTSSLLENNFDCAQESAATLTIESGTYYCAGGNVVKNENYGTLNINGGNFRSDAIDRGGSFSVLLVVGTANITNGTFTSTADGDGVRVVGTNGSTAALDITGGTFTVAASGAKALLLQNGDVDLDKGTLDVNIGGGTFNGDIGVDAHSFGVTETDEITISDGTFNGSVNPGVTIKSEITGGIFSEIVDATYYPADFVLCVNDEGKFTVAQHGSIPSGWQQVVVGAEMSGQSYSFASLQEALDEAKKLSDAASLVGNVQISLLGDITENIIIPFIVNSSNVELRFTINLHGYKIIGADNTPVITNNGKLTLSNPSGISGGSVVRDSDTQGVVIENNGTISFNNRGFIIENNNTADESYLIENNGMLTFSSSATYGLNTYSAAGGNLLLNNEGGKATLSGGNFVGAISNLSAVDGSVAIKGGTYSEIPDYKYFANGYVWTKNESGTFDAVKSENGFVAVIGNIGYTSLADALAAAQDGDEIDLLTNISAPGAINITNDITLDFNGHAIDSDRTIAIVIDGANANIISTGARGTLNTPANGISVINDSNVEISDIDIYTEIYILKKDDGSQQVYDGRAIQIVGSTAVIDNVVTSLTADNADYTVAHWYIGDSDVTITNSSVTLVYTRSAASAENGSLQGYAVYSDNSDVTIENSSISSTGDETAYGVIFFGNMAIAGAAAANGEGFKTLSLTDTAVIADAFAVSGNGTPNDCSGTDIVITGDCKIKSNYAQAIYHPQYGVLTINLTEDSALAYIRGVSGIEMRAGELVVIGGYIEATGDELDSMPNGNGSTTSGAAIAIVQHTTKQPINVRLDGGVFNGVFAVYEENQQNNEQAAVEKISLAINGGVFNGRIGSENLVDFVNGGKFAVMPEETYFADNYTGELYDGYYVVIEAVTEDNVALIEAQLAAQADARNYLAALGLTLADLETSAESGAADIVALYDAIADATSVSGAQLAKLRLMDAADEFVAARQAALDAYKAEKIAALETLAGDGYVPAYAIAAINGAASVAEVDACYNAAVAEINAADDGEITPPAPSDNGDGVSLTGVYVMLGVILVVAVAALMILLLKKQKQAEAAEAKAAAPLDRELAEVKQAVEADETAAAVSDAAEDDDKEQIVIAANVRTFDEAYDELDEEQKKLFNDVKDYALTKEGAALTELSSGVCVKKGSKQIVKLTVRRGNPVALFVIENEMIKDFRRNSDAPVKLKVKATELVLRSGGDLEAAKAMVDVAVDQIEKDILAAKERRREARRLRRQRKREQKRQ